METRILNLPRRRYSAEFKQEVVNACCKPNVSIARMALHHGLNVNLLRRWVVEHGVTPATRKARQGGNAARSGGSEFVPVHVSANPAPAADIRIEMRRGNATVVVNWPVDAADECGAWLREWLR